MLGAASASTLALAPAAQLFAQEDRYDATMRSAQQEYRARRYEEARALYRQAHMESPNPRTLRGIAMSSFELRDYVEAYRAMREALAFGPSPRDITSAERAAGAQLLARATAFIGVITNVPVDATVTINAVETPVETDGSLLFPLGTHHLIVTYPDGRVADLDFVVVGSENVALPEPEVDVAATRARARAAYEAGRFEEAANGYGLAAQTVGNDAGLWAAVGASRLALHQPEQAMEAYRRAVSLAPTNAGFHVGLGRAYWDAGNVAGARSEFEAALAIDPRNQDARTGLQRTQPAAPVEEPVELPPSVREPEPVEEPVEEPEEVPPGQRRDPVAEPRTEEPPPAETDDSGTRFRFQLFGMGTAGSFESNTGGHLVAGGGGGLAGLVQLGSVYAIGLQAAVNFVSLAEIDSLSDTPYWLETDVMLWNELRFGPLGINLGLGLALGVREASSFEDGFRNIIIRVDPSFGLAADARIYFADDLLFVAAGGRFAFGDFGGLAGMLAFGVEPVR
jgi:tetratricopeptide (TPR) repeat protein